jgi:putative methyltransferase (TIGR04325 family)
MIKSILKLFIPPIFLKFFDLFSKKTVAFEFHTTSLEWDDIIKKMKGYASENILIKSREALIKVKNGEYKYERDSVLFSELILFFPLLSSLFYIALKKETSINIIDFGGSLGSTYFQNREILKRVNASINWNVVEQEHYVTCGNEYFADDELKFFYSINDVLKNSNIDVCLLSSVLQYIKNPFDILDTIYASNIEYIIIDRTAFVKTKNDVLSIQKVNSIIYDAEYPAWFFSIEKFLLYIQQKYDIIYEWDSIDNLSLKGYDTASLGYFLKRKTKNNTI